MTHEEIHEMFRKRAQMKEELDPQKIQFIEFESYKELIPFLESLFKLKPSLITSFSIDKFRIVIENYTGTVRNPGGGGVGGTGKKSQGGRSGYQAVRTNDANALDKGTAGTQSEWNLSQAEEVIDYLREMGCKVPVMLYSDIHVDGEDGKQNNELLDPEESF
jgi:ribosomal protein S18